MGYVRAKIGLTGQFDGRQPGNYLQPCGWKLEDDQWVPILTSLPPAPDAIIKLVGCGCKTSHCSSNRCNSRKAGLNCTDLCACSDNNVPCANQPEEKYKSDDDDNYS